MLKQLFAPTAGVERDDGGGRILNFKNYLLSISHLKKIGENLFYVWKYQYQISENLNMLCAEKR